MSGECMTFPTDWRDFLNGHSFKDKEKIYTNGSELVQAYRVKQMVEHYFERTCRMTKKGPEFVLAGWWECSECGPVYPPCNDEIAVWALQKCPRCGAKVVE